VRLYIDSSALVCLYVREAATAAIVTAVQAERRAVAMNALQEFEVRNAIRQKVIHSLTSEGATVGALRALDDDIVMKRVLRTTVNWTRVFEQAEELSARHSLRRRARAIDLLHIAIALVSGVKRFLTLDAAQAEVARLAGLETDTGTLHR